MNVEIISAIMATGVSHDGNISKELNGYLVKNVKNWADLHGEDDYETGYHLDKTTGPERSCSAEMPFTAFSTASVTLVSKSRVYTANENGNKNAGFKRKSQRLSQLLADNMCKFRIQMRRSSGA